MARIKHTRYANFVLMRTFTSSSSDTIWQDYSLKIEATSSGMTSFAGAELLESEDLIFKHSRMPWGEKITVEGDSVSPSEDFTITIQPTNSIFYGPTTLVALTGVILLLGLLFCLRITRNRHRRFLMFELFLIPIVMLIYYFSYPPVFIGGAAIAVVSFAPTPLPKPSLDFQLESMSGFVGVRTPDEPHHAQSQVKIGAASRQGGARPLRAVRSDLYQAWAGALDPHRSDP